MLISPSYIKKGELRFHHKLSNGQHCCLYAKLNMNNFDVVMIDIYFAIGNSRRDCNNWFLKNCRKLDNKMTGKCGLEGLMFAMNVLKWMEEEYHNESAVIRIFWTDDKRKNAYRRLLKYGYEYNENYCYYKHLADDLIYVIN